jgi:hypothetical protein
MGRVQDYPTNHKIKYVDLDRGIIGGQWIIAILHDLLMSLLTLVVIFGITILYGITFKQKFNFVTLIFSLVLLSAGIIRGNSKLHKPFLDALLIYSLYLLIIPFELLLGNNLLSPLMITSIIYPFMVIFWGLQLRRRWNTWNKRMRMSMAIATLLFIMLMTFIILPILQMNYSTGSYS